MAVVEFTVYRTDDACGVSNTYICDAHGLAPASRVNRYVSNGHGKGTQCFGYHCPSDPELATGFMEIIRANYERQHQYSAERKKGHVTHVQLYVSTAKEDHVPPEEILEMTRELINRTILRDFPSIYTVHENTEVGHCHISLCPFSLDGTHKLSINNKTLYALRREMDHISYEYGHSIVDRAELRGDPEYRQWFEEVKAEGRIAIHPPKKEDQHLRNKPHKHQRDYDKSQRKKAKRKAENIAHLNELIQSNPSDNDDYIYASPYLYHPQNPAVPIRLRRLTEEGKERSQLELDATALRAWASICAAQLKTVGSVQSEALEKKFRKLAKNAYKTACLTKNLDIRNIGELIIFQKETGQDIGSLRRKICRQEQIIADLKQNNPVDPKIEVAEGRLESSRKLLNQRNKEYRDLKYAEAVLNPETHRALWEGFIRIFPSLEKKMQPLNTEDLEDRILEIAAISKIPADQIDELFELAEDTARVIKWNSCEESIYRFFNRGELEVRELRARCDELEKYGVLGVLLSLFVSILADLKSTINQLDLAVIFWETCVLKWFEDLHRPNNCEQIPYYSETTVECQKAAAVAQKHLNALLEKINEEVVLSQSKSCSLERGLETKNKSNDYNLGG